MADDLNTARELEIPKASEAERGLTLAERRMLSFLFSQMRDLSDTDWLQHGFRASTFDGLERKCLAIMSYASRESALTAPVATEQAQAVADVPFPNVDGKCNCVLYPNGETKPCVVCSPEAAPAAMQADKDAKTWTAYVAGIVETYLNGSPSPEVREKAIAGIIERRLWALPDASPEAAPAAMAGTSDEDMVNAAYCLHKYRQGTDNGIAFNRGARWMRAALAQPAPVQAVLSETQEGPLICGGNPTPIDADLVGCGKPIERPGDVYRCTDCAVPFHRSCAVKHFSTDTPEHAAQVLQEQLRRLNGPTPSLTMQPQSVASDQKGCRNCDDLGYRREASGEQIPCDLCDDRLETIRAFVEKATVEHTQGGDLWLTSHIAAKAITALAAPVQQDAPAPSMVGDAKGGA